MKLRFISVGIGPLFAPNETVRDANLQDRAKNHHGLSCALGCAFLSLGKRDHIDFSLSSLGQGWV